MNKRSKFFLISILLYGNSFALNSVDPVTTLPDWAIKIDQQVQAHIPNKIVIQDSDNLDKLYQEAVGADKELKQLTEKVAKETKGKAVFPPGLKGRSRAEEKVAAEEGGHPNKLFDIGFNYRNGANAN